MNILKKIIKKFFVTIGVLLHRWEHDIAKATLPEFANEPKNLFIDLPRRIVNSERIYFGDNVSLGPNCFLYPKTKFQEPHAPRPEQRKRMQQFSPIISIGNRVRCNGGLQIGAMEKIVIEDDVILADNVFISDGGHGFKKADEPYRYQLIDNIKPVIVKQGCWIGKNVVIMPGVTVGERTIVGSNSVVTKSLPAQCIATGAPVQVIKQWDEKSMEWKSVSEGDQAIKVEK